MIGHGSPRPSPSAPDCFAGRSLRRGLGSTLAVWLMCWLAGSAPAEETLRIRIAWGGGGERLWKGTIGVSRGTVAEPIPLGIEADEPGSMWLEDSPVEVPASQERGPGVTLSGAHLRVQQRSPRTYDGADLSVTAPLGAAVWLQLTAQDESKPSPWISIPIADLVGSSYSAALDDRGNRLLVRRAPGDELGIRLPRRSLVFAPGNVLRCEVEPHLLPVEAGTKVRLRAVMAPARGGTQLWAHDATFTAGEAAAIPLEVRLDRPEGVYELTFTAVQAGRFAPNVGQRLGLRTVLAERKLQFIVLEPRAGTPSNGGTWNRLLEIDPASPRWWDRFTKMQSISRLPGLERPWAARFWKGPLGNGTLEPYSHSLGPMVQLRPSDVRDPAWEAYPVPIQRPGQPHLLEIEYPSDVPQTLGISVVEPNSAGAVMPIGLDSGVEVVQPILGDGQRSEWRRHRLVFWPRTSTPLVLIVNRGGKTPAVYGKIRVQYAVDGLPRPLPLGGPRPERLWAAYLDRPLLPETFGASDPAGSPSDLSVDDWQTFYEAGTRLVDYLNYAGQNGLLLSVLADGSTIYPSRIVQPTPRYDSGMFFPSGQDPLRKDVLEMLLQLFDREGLQLIPAVEFAAPLPELEAIVRQGGSGSVGLQWIGPEGTVWTDRYPAVRGLAPYYNVLHPRVQEAMLGVIRELLGTYGHHPALAGLGLQLSAQGYAQLPGPEWGVDDATVGQFQLDTRIAVPGEGERRFAERAAFLTGPARAEWIRWRANRLTDFYARVGALVSAAHAHARLYLAGADSFGGEEWQRTLQPNLSHRPAVADALLDLGIDARRLQEDRNIVLLRGERIAAARPLAERALDLELTQMPDWDSHYAAMPTTGSLFFHPPREVRLPSFDEKSPFRPTYTWLVTLPVPSGEQNRRRFVHSLATLDSQVMFDGGWQLPLGQEDALWGLIAAYRQLPAARFQRLEPVAGNRSQPVTVRFCSRDSYTYAYAVNDAPFSTVLRLKVEAPAGCQIEELSGLRRIQPLERDADGVSWTCELQPYDLVAVRFSMPQLRLHSPQVHWSESIAMSLEGRISELGERIAALRTPPMLKTLENSGFETPPQDGQIQSWNSTAHPNTTVELDSKIAHEGSRSLRLVSQGPTASIQSRPFTAPATGRLSMWVWLRVADEKQQPLVRLAVEGKYRGREIPPRFAYVGQPPAPDAPSFPIPAGWSPFVFHVNDLPLEGLSQVRVRFDLIGQGEVWIDDVQLSDLAFNKKELAEMYRLIAPAEVQRENGQIGDCLHLLEGYWPRFLVEHVPASASPLTRTPASRPRQPNAGSSRESQRTGFLERMKNMLPDRSRF